MVACWRNCREPGLSTAGWANEPCAGWFLSPLRGICSLMPVSHRWRRGLLSSAVSQIELARGESGAVIWLAFDECFEQADFRDAFATAVRPNLVLGEIVGWLSVLGIGF